MLANKTLPESLISLHKTIQSDSKNEEEESNNDLHSAFTAIISIHLVSIGMVFSVLGCQCECVSLVLSIALIEYFWFL